MPKENKIKKAEAKAAAKLGAKKPNKSKGRGKSSRVQAPAKRRVTKEQKRNNEQCYEKSTNDDNAEYDAQYAAI